LWSAEKKKLDDIGAMKIGVFEDFKQFDMLGAFLTLDLWDPGAKIHRKSYLKDQGSQRSRCQKRARCNPL